MCFIYKLQESGGCTLPVVVTLNINSLFFFSIELSPYSKKRGRPSHRTHEAEPRNTKSSSSKAQTPKHHTASGAAATGSGSGRTVLCFKFQRMLFAASVVIRYSFCSFFFFYYGQCCHDLSHENRDVSLTQHFTLWLFFHCNHVLCFL